MFMNCLAILMDLVHKKLECIYWNISTKTLTFFECRSSVCLALRGIGMNTWVDMVKDSCSCCDELALLGLSAMYQRHCLEVTKNKFWSTIKTKEPLSIINLMKECSVRLLYLGNLKFGTLCWQPCNPQLAKPQLGQFKIIEEFTLDGPTTSGESSTPDNESEEHVETTKQSKSAPPPMNSEGTVAPPDSTQQTRKLVQENTESIPVNVETSDTTNTVKVETPVQTDSGNKSSKTVPCLKDLKVVVQKLDDLVNEESTGSANSPVETELKPIITSVCGYNLRSSRPYEEDTDDNDDEPKHKRSKRACPSRSGPSPERLLAHTNALINKVSSFVSKPSNEPLNDGTVSNLETSSQTNDQMLPVETSNSTPVRSKPARTIRCKICIDSFCSIKELNEHHRKDHGIVECEQCNKKFTTQSSLDKHMYLHSDLRFVCEDCGQSYLFKSRLEQHQITHQKELNYMCKHKGCSLGFKNKGGLQQTYA